MAMVMMMVLEGEGNFVQEDLKVPFHCRNCSGTSVLILEM